MQRKGEGGGVSGKQAATALPSQTCCRTAGRAVAWLWPGSASPDMCGARLASAASVLVCK